MWIVLFGDSLVIMSEKDGGAELEVAHLLVEPFEIEETTVDGAGESSRSKMLKLFTKSRSGKSRNFILSSKYAAALYVFHKLVVSQRTTLLEKQRVALEAQKRLQTMAYKESVNGRQEAMLKM